MRHAVRTGYCLLLLLLLRAPGAWALDPTQPVASYIRTTFTVEDGLPANVVNAILQSRDGFLWIGTGAGLVRFNGRDFTLIDFRLPGSVSEVVRALAEGPDGSLWVGTDFGVVRISDIEHYHPLKSATQVYHASNASDETLECLHFTRDGVLLAGTSRAVYRLSGSSFVSILPGVRVEAIEDASDGRLLIVADSEFLVWDHGRIIQHPELAATLAPRGEPSRDAPPPDLIHHVMQDRTGALWFSSHWGIARQSGAFVQRYAPYGGADTKRPIRTYEEANGTVWAVRNVGIFRAGADALEPLLTGVACRSILADRDGNLWIGTNGDGLVRFRDKPVHMFTRADGLPNNVAMAVLQRHDGTIWVGHNCGGLARFDGERFKVYDEENGLSNSCVWTLAEDSSNNLWIGTWGGGAFRFQQGKFQHYSKQQGFPSDIVRSIVAAPDGSMWFATDNGLVRIREGRIHTYSTADGLSSNHTIAVYADQRGTVLIGTSAGVDRLQGDRFVPLFSEGPILDPRYIGFGEPHPGELYAFGAPRGIRRVDSDRLTPMGPDLDLLSMAELPGKEVWFSGGNGLFRVPAASAGFASGEPFDYVKFDRADGLYSTQCSVGTPNMLIDRAHQLWVATVQGLARIDLTRLTHLSRPPALYIEEAMVDRQTLALPDRVVLSPGSHHLELKFDAIELTSPEKIRFQYRLDSVESGWMNAGATRTAIYTSVPLGSHLFHVRACNTDGVWDRTGVAFSIVQQPFFYETRAFRVVAVAIVVLLVGGLYRIRMRQLAAELDARMEERLNERMRIARDLHDTLLQSFQGLLLRFQAAHNLIPERPDEAKKTLSLALDRGAEALAEARNTVENLRESPIVTHNLARELGSICEDLQRSGVRPASATVEVEGEARELHPLLRDEVFRIASEALRNAFRHAEARRIQVKIAFGERDFQVQVSDDGKGIDPDIFQRGGRHGHWGLSGMRERADSIGGLLEVWSARGTGTRILLRIPGHRAYSKSALDRPE